MFIENYDFLVIFPFRGRLAPTKVEELIVLKENRRLLKAFKRDSEYKIKEGGQNAFGLVEAIIQEGEGEADNALGEQELEEELGMFYDDLEEEWLDEEEEH